MSERTDNYRLEVDKLGSGWAVLIMCDVHDDKLGTYSETDEYPLAEGVA